MTKFPLEDFKEWNKTGKLTTRLMMDAYLYEDRGGTPIIQDVEEINDAGRMMEIAVWFGRPDRANTETVKASKEYAEIGWDSGMPFDLELGADAVQTYYRDSPARGHSFRNQEIEVFLWGCAGRVMMTISSTKDRDTNITWIFDETSKYPRGGLQGLYGTKQECIELFQKAQNAGIKFERNDEVSMI